MWSDSPLLDKSGDRLGRARFAGRVADVVEQAQIDSTVFGLVGPWGCGKTSVLNMIKSDLSDEWQVRFFSPWAASDLNSLLTEFFTVVTSALPPDAAKKARKALLACARVAVPALSAVPYAGGVVRAAGDKAIEHLAKEPPWAERFDAACKELQKLRLKVLIVVDDVDRLHADELAILLKAIRLLGRFPGVHYLLSYDEETVLTVLRASSVAGGERGRALSFLEKIVQVPLVVPPAQRRHLDRLVNETVERITEQASNRLTDVDLDRFQFAYQEGMTRGLTTVRSIYRFGTQASAYLPLVGADDLNLADFLILTYVRLQHPSVFAQLPFWRWQLTGDGRPLSCDPVNPQSVDCALMLVAAGVAERDIEPLRTCLEVVFPLLAGDRLSVAASIGKRTSDRRANFPAYFDRYLNIGIPEGDISDVASNALTEAMSGGGPNWNEVMDWLDRYHEAADQARLVGKLSHLSSSREEEDAIERAHIAARLIRRTIEGGAFTGDPRRECVRWLGQELHRAQIADSEASAVLHRLRGEADDLWYVLRAVEIALSDYGPATSFLKALTREAADVAATAALEHFAAKDHAPDNGPFVMLDFAVKHGNAEGLRDAIARGVNNGEYSVEDVAARCISIGYLNGTSGVGEIIRFDDEFVRTLLKDEVLMAYIPAPVSEVDKLDVSWSGRRAVTRGILINWREQLQARSSTNTTEVGAATRDMEQE